MGTIKRMLRRTSQKLLSKIVPPSHSQQLVLNPHQHMSVVENGVVVPANGANNARLSSSSNRRINSLQKKLNKYSSSKESAVAEALLLAAKNHLPPVQFHHVHGAHAQLSKNKCVARRTQGFCQALVFSNRVILPNERVYIKVLDIAKGWSGTIRFGFTSVDPATLAVRMPKHACPDMTNAGHTWARALADDVVKRNSVIHFSYNKNGLIHYGINNQDCGIFYANVNTKQNLWFIVDIYGLTAAVELIDPRVHSATSEIDFSQIDDELGLRENRGTMHKSTSAMDEIFGRYTTRTKKKHSRKASARQAQASFMHHPRWPVEGPLVSDPLGVRFVHQQIESQHLPNLNSLALPSTQQNIYSPMPIGPDGLAADVIRNDSHDYHQIMSNAIYDSHPLRANYLAQAESAPAPISLQSAGTSNASNLVAASARDGHNNVSPVDAICHQFDTVQLNDLLQAPRHQAKQTTKSPNMNNNSSVQMPVAARRRQAQNNLLQTSSKQTPDSRDRAAKSLARCHSYYNGSGMSKQKAAPTPSSSSSSSSASSSPLSATTTANTSAGPSVNVKPKARHSIKSQKASPASRDNNENSPPSKDCPICFERPINCVLYQCGHMCTCYECGVKQWKTQSRTCPICRTIIKDVIKTYMS